MLNLFKNWHPLKFIIFSLFFNICFIILLNVIFAKILHLIYKNDALLYIDLYDEYLLFLYIPLVLYQAYLYSILPQNISKPDINYFISGLKSIEYRKYILFIIIQAILFLPMLYIAIIPYVVIIVFFGILPV